MFSATRQPELSHHWNNSSVSLISNGQLEDTWMHLPIPTTAMELLASGHIETISKCTLDIDFDPGLLGTSLMFKTLWGKFHNSRMHWYEFWLLESTKILGYNFSAPFYISPCARAGLGHADAEKGLIRGANTGDILYIVRAYSWTNSGYMLTWDSQHCIHQLQWKRL